MMSAFPQHRMELWSLRYEDILIEASRERLASDVSRDQLVGDANRDMTSHLGLSGALRGLLRAAVRVAGSAAKPSLSRRVATV